ncbi:MAG: hypothetical protein AAFN77_19260 [Planctomycetota bacterium]
MALKASSGSPREKWVLTFIPTVAIFMLAFGYIAFFVNPAMKKLQGKYDSAKSSTITPDVIDQLKWQKEQLLKQQIEMQEIVRSVAKEVAAKSEAFQQLSPTEKHSGVMALCREHGVAILQDTTVKNIALPTLRSKSVETLRLLVPKEAIGFRELTLEASYGKIVALLKSLPDIPGVIPVKVQLEKTAKPESGSVLSVSSGTQVSWTVGLLM